MNRENLKKLADGLRGPLAAEFDMSAFVAGTNSVQKYQMTSVRDFAKTHCGTAACAAGHATYLVESKYTGEDFHDYIDRVFGLKIYGGGSLAWEWVFGGLWGRADGTPQGCADRIDWLLAHGAPKNCEDQMLGNAPLCYRSAA